MDGKINGWEYKETTTRKGKIIIFGKLDELLKSYYHVNTIGALDQFKSNYKEQYIINCPFCQHEGHSKKKLHIYPNTSGSDDFSEGYCFVCGRTFLHINDEIDVNFKVPDFLGTNKPFEFIPIEDKYWTLEKFNDEFDSWSEKGIEYLVNRNPYLETLWRPLGFKFYEDHVAMPFRNPDGELIYYQIRFIDATKNFGVRFHFPKISAKPPYILHSSNADPEKIIICEGIFDCIAAWIQCGGKYVCIALMGSKVSDYQLAFIQHWYMPKKIVFWLDETRLSKDICTRFKSVFNYSNMAIVKSESGYDPEEILNHRIRVGKKIDWLTPEFGDNPKGDVYYPKFKLNFL